MDGVDLPMLIIRDEDRPRPKPERADVMRATAGNRGAAPPLPRLPPEVAAAALPAVAVISPSAFLRLIGSVMDVISVSGVNLEHLCFASE